MLSMANIRVLEKEPNKLGDLFCRFMGDLFLALGYDNHVRFNIHKSGRELDLEVMHRTEPRCAIAECKATADKIGGAEINKFFGAIDVERRQKEKNNIQMTGYYISLSGFAETAIQQELDTGVKRLILMNGNQVIEALIKGHIIVPLNKAMERGGRCAAAQSNDLRPELCEILAHNIGWVWGIYFTQNKQQTHFALIHADGEALAPDLADMIIQSDKEVGGTLHSLTYLPPSTTKSIEESEINEAQKKYYNYLESECGKITLEGLPADQEVGSRSLTLEHIFVPLYLEESLEYPQFSSLSKKKEPQKVYQIKRELVGEILSKYSRLAILATPGGGKTTLLKRLAIAYAFPERRKVIDDNLPDNAWLPIFIRCRQLREKVKLPINDIIQTIPEWAEISDLKDAFMVLMNRALRSGNSLLLIDGLDEIADESSRILFVHQLRTFLATYPTVNIIVTSREAGFRIIGGSLSEHCEHYKIADFDNNDIMRLTVAWHKEVVGEKSEIISEAEKLAQSICATDRVKNLAKNPLLLTTLLLVKRWVGQLPTRRSLLYGKAIEVLLMTWNVEGYEPIDQDEAIPQLAFIAFTMMNDGVQRISEKRLKEALISARKQMPEILGYAKVSVTEFIRRVELRSSLLMLSGHEIEDGTLCPMYEFRHLTFQEYLTAIAIVDGYYPDRKDDDTMVKIIEPHLITESWKEVIPLVAVLAGRKVQPLICHLIALCKSIEKFERHSNFKENYPVILLTQCIIDEIQINPDILKEGLEVLARLNPGQNVNISLYRSKYGSIFKEVVQNTYINSKTDLGALGCAFANIILEELNYKDIQDITPQLIDKITNFLNNANPLQKISGILVIMAISCRLYCTYEVSLLKLLDKAILKALASLGDTIVSFLYSDETYLHCTACWAFSWLGESGIWHPKNTPEIISRLLDIWMNSDSDDTKYFAQWAITVLPIIDRDLNPIPKPTPAVIEFIKQNLSDHKIGYSGYRSYSASLIIGFYLKAPWSDKKLADFFVKVYKKNFLAGFRRDPEPNFVKILEALGEAGKKQLEAIKKYKKENINKQRFEPVI